MTMKPRQALSGETSAKPNNMPGGRVLHVGSGPIRTDKLHPVFRSDGWQEVRTDIDPKVEPDLVLDISDMVSVEANSFDAIWCSHCLEHLDEHKVERALREFCRILKPTGFALITSPDLLMVAQLVVDGREDMVAYVSPAGEVRAIDMMFGFQPSIAAGNEFMRHNTGFTRKRIGRMMQAAGFAETRIVTGRSFDLWAAGFCDKADTQAILNALVGAGVDFQGGGQSN